MDTAVRARDAEFVHEHLLLVDEFPILRSFEAKTPAEPPAARQAAEHFLEKRDVQDHAPSLEFARLLLVGASNGGEAPSPPNSKSNLALVTNHAAAVDGRCVSRKELRMPA